MAGSVDLVAALGQADVSTADALACQGWLGQIRQVRGWLDALEARILTRVDALAATGASHGADDTSVRCSGVSSREAGKRRSRASTLDRADGFADALATGAVTGEHVDRLAAVATTLDESVRDSLFGHSAELLSEATSSDPARFGRHVRDLATRLARQAGISRDRQQRSRTRLTWSIDGDGMYDVRAHLHPELGARLIGALDAEVAARIAAGEARGEPDFVNRTVDRSRLAAEALVDFVAARHQSIRPLAADITLLVNAADLTAETVHGAAVPVETVRTLLCSGRSTPVVIGSNGVVLDVGRARRTPTPGQRRALRAMYRTCAAAGCDTLFNRCELHHITPWEHGGVTDLDNLVPVCSRHHHLVHSLDWTLQLDDDRTLTVTDAHGRTVMVTTPDQPRPGPAAAGDHTARTSRLAG